MAEATRKTRMAVTEELAGLPVAPTSGSDYLAVQDGLNLQGGFEELESAELKAGLGASKSTLGPENPEASLSHYIYHSGVSGTPPEMHLLIKGAFGDSSIAVTEYNIVSATAGSLTLPATVTVGVGQGAFFERGEAVILKFPSGSVIRNIESIAGDILTLSFNLANVTGLVGTGLGKAVLYKPHADETPPSLTLWDYRGNGAAVQMISGTKVSEMSIEAEAGALINASFSFAGVEFFFDPIELTATSNVIDFTTDAGPVSATLSAKFYKHPHDAASALASAMTSVAGGQIISVVYSDTDGKFTASANGVVFDVDWATTVNTLGAKFGFTADDSGALSYVSDVAIGLASPQTPALDGQDPLVAKSNSVLLGEFYDNVCFPSQSINFTLSNEITDVREHCADSGVSVQVNGPRSVSVEIRATLEKYNAQQFKRFQQNQTTKFAYAFGPKSGGSFVEGKSGVLYIPKCTISAFTLDDQDGIVVMNMTLKAFSQSGEGEVFFNFI